MNLVETFRTALDALRAHRTRSVLTVLGILIGIAAVMLTVALGEAARTLVLSQINSMGTNLIVVVPGNQQGGPENASVGTRKLTVADVQALSDKTIAPDVAGVAPVNETYASVTAGDTQEQMQVSGTTPDWLSVRGRSMQSGRFFTADELDQGARVAVLGVSTARSLLGTGDPVGATVTISGQNLTVIGLLNTAGSAMGMDQDNLVVVPRTTLLQRISPGSDPDDVGVIYLQAANEQSLSPAYQEIDSTLMTLHGTTPSTADFTIFTQQSLIDTASSTAAILTGTLGGIAAISLLVGGIGVMNIMLVSVTERIREIGLRKALGATPSAIRNQFLVEASMLGLLGGVLGLGLGMAGAWLIATATSFPVVPSFGAAMIALLVSLVIGIGAGVYPATRAARLAPIDALRTE